MASLILFTSHCNKFSLMMVARHRLGSELPDVISKHSNICCRNPCQLQRSKTSIKKWEKWFLKPNPSCMIELLQKIKEFRKKLKSQSLGLRNVKLYAWLEIHIFYSLFVFGKLHTKWVMNLQPQVTHQVGHELTTSHSITNTLTSDLQASYSTLNQMLK